MRVRLMMIMWMLAMRLGWVWGLRGVRWCGYRKGVERVSKYERNLSGSGSENGPQSGSGCDHHDRVIESGSGNARVNESGHDRDDLRHHRERLSFRYTR